jgi:hypothetical protein
MNACKRVLIAVTGPLVVAFLLALVSAPPAQTQAAGPAARGVKPPPPPPPPTPVEVKNLPLPVTGTLNASVAGTVQAQQNGPWNVGINGTPGVNVANSPTVKVGNSPAEPIPVSGNISAMLAGPLHAQQSGSWNVGVLNEQTNAPYNVGAIQFPISGENGAVFDFDVPAGQRLIVETVTVGSRCPPGQGVSARLFVVGVVFQLRLSLDLQGMIGDGEERVGTHPVSFWVDDSGRPDPDIRLFMTRFPDAGPATMEASVSGHLVPLP